MTARHVVSFVVGIALFGLAQSLRAQGKTTEAAPVEERFRKAWAQADVKPTASRF